MTVCLNALSELKRLLDTKGFIDISRCRAKGPYMYRDLYPSETVVIRLHVNGAFSYFEPFELRYSKALHY